VRNSDLMEIDFEDIYCIKYLIIEANDGFLYNRVPCPFSINAGKFCVIENCLWLIILHGTSELVAVLVIQMGYLFFIHLDNTVQQKCYHIDIFNDLRVSLR
jgi:hypothetical protein